MSQVFVRVMLLILGSLGVAKLQRTSFFQNLACTEYIRHMSVSNKVFAVFRSLGTTLLSYRVPQPIRHASLWREIRRHDTIKHQKELAAGRRRDCSPLVHG